MTENGVLFSAFGHFYCYLGIFSPLLENSQLFDHSFVTQFFVTKILFFVVFIKQWFNRQKGTVQMRDSF